MTPARHPFVTFIIIVTGLMLVKGTVWGQDKDFRSWNDISIETELMDDLDIQAEIGLRFDNNATRLDENLYEVELQYKGVSDYDISTSYRFGMNNEIRYFEYYHRWTVEGELEKDIDPFEFEFRTRLQTEYYPSVSFEDRYEHYLRDRITITWKIDDFPADPSFGIEHYAPLNNKPFVFTDKNRFILGTDIDLDDGFSLDISYRFQRHYDDIPEYDYILSLGLGYEL
ncbi:MAG: DUF2490 domain-containing protein [Bacteroidales bacterium]|nr:DUF2490 domain-containing protein [Bacteroidales bacterium]